MRRLLLPLLLALLSAPLTGQTGPEPEPGQRVWIRTVTSPGRLDAGFKGTLERVADDSVRIRMAGSEEVRSLARGPQTRLFVFAGRRSSAGRGAAYGGGGGALAGAVLGFAGGEDCTGQFLCFSRGQLAAGGAVLLGGIGLIGGLVVGGLSSHEAWVSGAWPGSVRPVIAPRQGGVGLGLSLSF